MGKRVSGTSQILLFLGDGGRGRDMKVKQMLLGFRSFLLTFRSYCTSAQSRSPLNRGEGTKPRLRRFAPGAEEGKEEFVLLLNPTEIPRAAAEPSLGAGCGYMALNPRQLGQRQHRTVKLRLQHRDILQMFLTLSCLFYLYFNDNEPNF